MKVLFICKASTQIGLGHLIRSRSLALKFFQKLQYQGAIEFIAIGPKKIVSRLLNHVAFNVSIFETEEDIKISSPFDIIFFDMLSMHESTLKAFRNKGKVLISISPIFDQMKSMDILFHRSKYLELEDSNTPRNIYKGLEYAIIQENCIRISTARYEENLENHSFPIAISMGGGDAANKTLTILKSLKNCKVPATFWVMLGEGYRYSYDSLINEIVKDSQHEIILARTNKSMWQILQNCVLAILPGGITTYEAAYAGLPTINFTENVSRQFIIRELSEANSCFSMGDFSEKNLSELNNTIEMLYQDRLKLISMHLDTKRSIDGKGMDRIFDLCYSTIVQMN